VTWEDSFGEVRAEIIGEVENRSGGAIGIPSGGTAPRRTALLLRVAGSHTPSRRSCSLASVPSSSMPWPRHLST
jgi:hypothetical protein